MNDALLQVQTARIERAKRMQADSLRALALSNRSTVALVTAKPDEHESTRAYIDWRFAKMRHANRRAELSRRLFNQAEFTRADAMGELPELVHGE